MSSLFDLMFVYYWSVINFTFETSNKVENSELFYLVFSARFCEMPRSNYRRYSVKRIVLKKFADFTEKPLCWRLLIKCDFI